MNTLHKMLKVIRTAGVPLTYGVPRDAVNPRIYASYTTKSLGKFAHKGIKTYIRGGKIYFTDLKEIGL